MLQNAVHPIMELRQAKIQAAQFRTHTGKDLSYDEYCSLLLSAAQQYDAQIGNNGQKWQKEESTSMKFLTSTMTIILSTPMTMICP